MHSTPRLTKQQVRNLLALAARYCVTVVTWESTPLVTCYDSFQSVITAVGSAPGN